MNYQESILSALIAKNQQEKPMADAALKEVIKSRVNVHHFQGHYRTLFEIISLQAQRPSILDMDLLSAYLESSDLTDEKKAEIKILFSTCRNQYTAIDKIPTICKAFIEEQNFQSFSMSLMTAGEILTAGKKIGRSEFKGLADAKKYLVDSISTLHNANDDSYPSDSLVEAVPVFWENYFRREANPQSGLLTGLTEIDEQVNGFDPGEFIIFAAAYGEGKSTLLRNFAYNAAFKQKKNVVYFTLEMPHSQIMRELISLHSLDPKFGRPKGITSNAIRDAKLEPADKALLREITDDIVNNINYGILKIIQLPNNSTVSTIREMLMYLQNEFPLHGVFVDYASLLVAEVNRPSTIAEISDTMKKMKNLANTFNNGAGIPVISAHQISRDARSRVDKMEDPQYDRSFLSDTSEAEKSADQIYWALRTEDYKRSREIRMGISKNRRGECMPSWFVRENFSCGFIGSLHNPKKEADKEKEVYAGMLDGTTDGTVS